MMNKQYVVYGDLTSDKSSDNYPTMTLCYECVASHEVVAEEGESSDPCEECGHEAHENLGAGECQEAE